MPSLYLNITFLNIFYFFCVIWKQEYLFLQRIVFSLLQCTHQLQSPSSWRLFVIYKPPQILLFFRTCWCCTWCPNGAWVLFLWHLVQHVMLSLAIFLLCVSPLWDVSLLVSVPPKICPLSIPHVPSLACLLVTLMSMELDLELIMLDELVGPGCCSASLEMSFIFNRAPARLARLLFGFLRPSGCRLLL